MAQSKIYILRGTGKSNFQHMGQDSSVGIATRNGLDGPGIESRCGREFPQSSRPPLGSTHPHIQWVPGLNWV